MFIRVKRHGERRYLQLVRKHRVGHRAVQRVMCELGRLERLQAEGQIDVLLHSLSRFGHRFELLEKDRPHVSTEGNAPGLDTHVAVSADPKSGRKRGPDIGRETSRALVGSSSPKSYQQAGRLLQVSQIGILRKCKLFSDLGSYHLAELSSLATQRKLKRGQFLYLQNDPMDELYVVASGLLKTVRISPSGREIVGAIFRQGDPVATIMLFVDEPYQLSCQAIRDSCILQIRKCDLLGFLERYPEAGHAVLMRMISVGGRRSRNTARLLFELATERTDYRLSSTLAALNAEYGGVIPFTRREIAELAGTAPETATRYVSRLRDRGVLRSMRGKLVVLEPKGLGLLR